MTHVCLCSSVCAVVCCVCRCVLVAGIMHGVDNILQHAALIGVCGSSLICKATRCLFFNKRRLQTCIFLTLLSFFCVFFLLSIPLKKFRSIRRELTDSGKRAEELLADRHSLKYNLGFPSGNGPTPELLKNYLDVSIALSPNLWPVQTFKSSLSRNALWSWRAATTKVLLCRGLFFCKSSRAERKIRLARQEDR